MFRGNQPIGSGEDFLRFYTIYGRGGHLGHVTQMPRRNLVLIGQVVFEKKTIERVDADERRTYDGCRSMGIPSAQVS